jgi:hypothetical protein
VRQFVGAISLKAGSGFLLAEAAADHPGDW